MGYKWVTSGLQVGYKWFTICKIVKNAQISSKNSKKPYFFAYFLLKTTNF